MNLVPRPAWMTGSPDNDWPEDSGQENGNYFCKCVCCACDFIGHKRRHVCRKCESESRAAYEVMTQEEREEFHRKREAAIAEFLNGNPDFVPKKGGDAVDPK